MRRDRSDRAGLKRRAVLKRLNVCMQRLGQVKSRHPVTHRVETGEQAQVDEHQHLQHRAFGVNSASEQPQHRGCADKALRVPGIHEDLLQI